MKKIVYIIIFVFLLSCLLFLNGDKLLLAASESERSSDGGVYDDPSNPYDHSCCISLTGGIPPDEDPYEGDDDPFADMASHPFNFFGTNVQWNSGYAFNELFDAFNSFLESETPNPSVDISFSQDVSVKNPKIEAIISPLNFRTRPNNVWVAWCVKGQNKEGGITEVNYNSVVAGGTIPEAGYSSYWDSRDGGCCYPIERTPKNDSDGNGMDDEWEMLYFERIGADPLGDPDRDGYKADMFINEKGETMTVTPEINTPHGVFRPGADDKLTNIEEFVLGTNPIDPDTDDDGYGDEEDFLGRGQMAMVFDTYAEAGPGSGYDVTATVLGINMSKKIGITSFTKTVYVGAEGELKVNLLPSSSSLYIGEDIVFNVEASLQTPNDWISSLEFDWIIDGERSCDSSEPWFKQFCGPGKTALQISNISDLSRITDKVTLGNFLPIKVEVRDPVFNKKVSASLEVPVGVEGSITVSECASNDGKSWGDGGSHPGEVPANAKEVHVCMQNAGSGSSTNEYSFVWSLDGAVDKLRSGTGSKFEEYVFDASKNAGESHVVSLEVVELSTNNKFVSGRLIVPIIGSAVKIEGPDTVGAGSSAVYTAKLVDFSNANQIRYDWQVNGTRRSSATDDPSFTLRIPQNVASGSKYNISVQASYAVLDQPMEAAVASKEIKIGVSTASAGIFKKMFSGMAAAFSFVPSTVQGFFKIFVSILGLFAVLIGFSALSYFFIKPRNKI